jgi:hypothetical protein
MKQKQARLPEERDKDTTMENVATLLCLTENEIENETKTSNGKRNRKIKAENETKND